MRVFAVLLLAVAVPHVLSGCAIVGQVDAKKAADNFKKCTADNRATPQFQLISGRLWLFDGTDTAAKLSDPKPLTQPERDALVQTHNGSVQCRQILINHDNQFAAWETQYWQELFQRSDEIFYKLASGELPVGVANKLTIESVGKFQVDVSKGHADAVRADEIQRQRTAEAMIQAGAQIAASQPQPPRMTTTNCMWVGNMINCTSM